MQVTDVNLKDVLLLDNTRGADLEVGGLMSSIKKSGLFQPVCLGKNFTKSKHKYVLAAGNRRFSAIKKLGLTKIPAVINPNIKDKKDLMIINLSENVHRKDVSAYEQGRFIYELISKYNMSEAECAARIGISNPLVKLFKSAFENTPEAFRDAIVYSGKSNQSAKGKVPLRTAVLLNNAQKDGLINQRQIVSLYKKVSSNAYNTRHVMDVISKLKKGSDFSAIVEHEKQVSTFHVQVQLYNKDKERLTRSGKTLQTLFEDILYGESSQKFKRPKV